MFEKFHQLFLCLSFDEMNGFSFIGVHPSINRNFYLHRERDITQKNLNIKYF